MAQEEMFVIKSDTAPQIVTPPSENRRVSIDARGLSKRYILSSGALGHNSAKTRGKSRAEREFWALKDISFKLHAGERLGIIGQNGAGKSTLLKILSRVLNPTAGEAFIYGRVTSLLEVGTGFNPALTGRQNIYLNAALHGLKRHEIDKQMSAIIDFSEIGRFVDEPVKTYSTGMRSRLGFSVAAHLDPDILMLDEVLSVGDASFQRKCLERMDDLTGHDRTLIFVSHSIGAVRRFCDRCIWLNHGEIVMDGDAKEVCEAYEGQMMQVSSTYQAPAPALSTPKTTRNTVMDEARSSVLLEAEAGDNAMLVSAQILDQAGEPARSIKIDEPSRIEIVYDVLKPGLRIEPALHFKNDRGEMLFVIAFTDPSFPDAISKPGRYHSTIQIPGNLLNEGLHFVTIVMATADPLYRHQVVERAIAFSVYEVIGDTTKVARGRYSRAFPGGLRPRLEWKTETQND
jgi:lipopolysaccharide transport system ATP-binding protein